MGKRQDDRLRSGLSQGMNGATQRWKANLRRNVDDDTFNTVCRTALQIINGLPKDVPLGSLTGALMLAATAFAEGASQAPRLIDAPDKSDAPHGDG